MLHAACCMLHAACCKARLVTAPLQYRQLLPSPFINTAPCVRDHRQSQPLWSPEGSRPPACAACGLGTAAPAQHARPPTRSMRAPSHRSTRSTLALPPQYARAIPPQHAQHARPEAQAGTPVNNTTPLPPQPRHRPRHHGDAGRGHGAAGCAGLRCAPAPAPAPAKKPILTSTPPARPGSQHGQRVLRRRPAAGRRAERRQPDAAPPRAGVGGHGDGRPARRQAEGGRHAPARLVPALRRYCADLLKSRSSVQSLPSSVFCVGTAARVLDASNNQLSALPTQVAALSALQRLILSNNKLEALPLEVFSLKHLKVARQFILQSCNPV